MPTPPRGVSEEMGEVRVSKVVLKDVEDEGGEVKGEIVMVEVASEVG